MYSIELQFVYVTSNGTKCSIEMRAVFLLTGQWPNVTNLICSTPTMCSIERKTVPSDRAVDLISSMYII